MRQRATSSLLVAIAASVLLLTLLSPALAADRDGDGLRDGFEIKGGVTSPDKRDSDGDGVIDSAEDNDRDRLGNLGEQRFKTHPGKKDSDGDGIIDGNEDRDRDGRSNAREQDQRPLPANLRPSLGKAAADAPTDRANCLTKARKSALTWCWFGPSDSDTTVALLGDSHALMWLPPAITAAKAERWRLVSLVKGGCSPVLGTINTGQWDLDRGKSCRAWRNRAYQWLDENPVDLLIIAHADSYQLVNSKGRVIQGKNKVSVWKAGMRRTLDGIADPSRVLLWGDVPNNARNPIHCLKKSRSNISACATKKEPRSKRTIENALRTVAADKGAQAGTLYGQICTYDPCPLVQGPILMWRDSSHVTATFANKLAPSVRELMRSGLSNRAGFAQVVAVSGAAAVGTPSTWDERY